MLQCRVGKRTVNRAALNMAMGMMKEKLISDKDAVLRLSPSQLDELLHPLVDPAAEQAATVIAKGLPAGPGGAFCQSYSPRPIAVEWAKQGKRFCWSRRDQSEDVEGMRAAQGILTGRGGMTTHAALVARGWGKCCIVGCSALTIDLKAKKMFVAGKEYQEGDYLTLNGTKGYVYSGAS
jgi:pyruvate,orthophosphate dikinase